jgi:predicted AlkP superfamily pyrophosphatase or phosphodiesterase
MIGNAWVDRSDGTLHYNVDDERYPILPTRPDAPSTAGTEAKPSEKVRRKDGISPTGIISTTFGDQLGLHYGERSKIFGIAGKDRAAVPMAGHLGKAFWFSTKSGDFTTSRFYYSEYPAWAREWNAKKLPDSYAGKSWELLHERSSYHFGQTDDRPYEVAIGDYGRTFPHPFGELPSKNFYRVIAASPVGDELLLDFAKNLIDKEQLGQDEIPDYLAISFSATDMIGHIFGPASLETEDNILRLDRTLAELLGFLEKQVGLKNTLVVLSADHGAPEAPEYMKSKGISAGWLTKKHVDTQAIADRLSKRFGVGLEVIAAYRHPYFYLDDKLIAEKNIDRAALERELAQELMKIDGVYLTLSSTDLRTGMVPETPIIEQIRRNYHPKRSGDIYVVQEPFWQAGDEDWEEEYATRHGSPWRYDTYVPLVFIGGQVPKKTVMRQVLSVDVAPTLSAYLGIVPPAGATGVPLTEVFETSRETPTAGVKAGPGSHQKRQAKALR